MIVSTPEKGLNRYLFITVDLLPFADTIVFPQLAGILSQGEWREILNNGVPNAGITKKPFFTLTYFFAKVIAVGG